jgi:hypothetical protein
MKKSSPNRFEQAAAQRSGGGIVGEFWEFLRTNRKWWLVPILVVFFFLALLIVLAGTGLAPFIYTLF